jgi:hypothetical protein
MFDSKKTLPGRLADAVDLLIDFATLGEYGLEPGNSPVAPCEARRRARNQPASRPLSDRTLTTARA